MPAAHGRSSSVFLNAYNVSAFLSSFDSTQTVDTAEVTTFGSTSKSFVTGLRDGTITLGGYFDGGAAALDEIMTLALLSEDKQVLSICQQGATTLGSPAILGGVLDTSYQITGSISEAVQISAEFQGDATDANGWYRGFVLGQLKSWSVSENGSTLDNGVSTSNGLIANLHYITNWNGNHFHNVLVQDSLDGLTWNTLINYSSSTRSRGVTRTTTGIVQRYLRVQHTGSAAGTFVLTAARK